MAEKALYVYICIIYIYIKYVDEYMIYKYKLILKLPAGRRWDFLCQANIGLNLGVVGVPQSVDVLE